MKLWAMAFAIPNCACGIRVVCAAPYPFSPPGVAEATPEEASIIASMSAIAAMTASFFLNTSCVLLP